MHHTDLIRTAVALGIMMLYAHGCVHYMMLLWQVHMARPQLYYDPIADAVHEGAHTFMLIELCSNAFLSAV